MKKLLLIATTLAIIASCNKETELEISSSDVAASFESATITRATGEEWAANDQIGIFAYDEADAIYNNYKNIPYKTESGGVTATFTPTSTTIYYPTGSSTLSFIAYSPYQALADDGIYDVNLSPQSTTAEVAAIDLIVADDGAQYSNTNTEANLKLDHKLAKLTMTLENSYGLNESDLADVEVKLTNIATEGTYNLESGQFEYGTADQTITPRTITDGSQYEAIILPENSASFKVEFTLTNGKTYTWQLSGDTFTSGIDHAYTVYISESDIIISTANLSGWEVKDSENLTAESLVTTISTAAELKAIATAVNSGEATYEGVTIKLTQNINLEGSETNQWTSIGYSDKENDKDYEFKGTFDGGGYTISGLYISESADEFPTNFALFNYINSAVIKNLTVEGQILGYAYLAGVVFSAVNSSIINCCNKVNITTKASDLNSFPPTTYGGVVAYAEECTISSSCNLGDITTTDQNIYIVGGVAGTMYGGSMSSCYNRGSISGYVAIGGLVGSCGNSITIENCYNASSVYTNFYESGITLPYSDGLVGAIAGWVTENSVKINNCYWVSDITGAPSAAITTGSFDDDEGFVPTENIDITAKTINDMQSDSFSSVLSSDFKEDSGSVNGGYPILSWQ